VRTLENHVALVTGGLGVSLFLIQIP